MSCSPWVFSGLSNKIKVTEEKINTDRQQHCGPAVFSISSIFASTRLTVSSQNHFANSQIVIREPRMAVFSFNGAFKWQEKDTRQCLRRDYAHCWWKSLQPEPEAGPIKNTCLLLILQLSHWAMPVETFTTLCLMLRHSSIQFISRVSTHKHHVLCCL